ncbi:MAG: hypothetical protein A3H98_02770 [Bacteroidetes bacterium RIFCSPLOWO2_02_FULL_36_8]|nr:MAG: hypothetical protein A3H98_02770 [Bacteroidetes bacterium RIFCSPLOWO2_02_FULL_36_8]OFY72204.1 MAG: hypothetical protein A3G23_01390 [Bacteroidetes bacterium RIFCSPLOWO2_12_FULL_37_12]
MKTITLNIENPTVYNALIPFLKSIGINISQDTEYDKEKVKVDRSLTANKLLNSQLVGLWKDRKNIKNTSLFAREIRNEVQNRKHYTK